MSKVKLLDYFGFTVGEPEIPQPFPHVIVWGNEFFVIDAEDTGEDCESPRYRMTSGFVVSETKEHANAY